MEFLMFQNYIFKVKIANKMTMSFFFLILLFLTQYDSFDLQWSQIKIQQSYPILLGSSRHLNRRQMAQASAKSIKLTYNVLDRIAKKVATLIKIANLDFQIQQNHDETSSPHILQTPSGQLHKEYQIIYYIIAQARQRSANPPPAIFKKQPEEVKGQSEDGHSEVEGSTHQTQICKTENVVNLQANDPFITAKMYEKLHDLRVNLFPLLHQFYKYLTGNQKTKKSKYDSLMNKIKKQLGVLDADINEHPEIYHSQFNFLNIIIACEIFMACKFVFEEKFRKSKYSLFNKYEKISHRKEFYEIHGKSQLCQKQLTPSQFEEDGAVESNTKQSVIPTQIVKISNNILSAQPDSSRNQLLYNYFRSIFSQNQSKKQYFPYFWLMFDELNCCLIQIVQNVEEKEQESGTGKMKMLQKKIIHEINPEIDYGVIGLYRSQKQKITLIRGLICLGSKSGQQFETNFSKQELMDIKLHRVDSSSEKQRREVEKIWENAEQKSVENEIKVVMILHI